MGLRCVALIPGDLMGKRRSKLTDIRALNKLDRSLAKSDVSCMSPQLHILTYLERKAIHEKS